METKQFKWILRSISIYLFITTCFGQFQNRHNPFFNNANNQHNYRDQRQQRQFQQRQNPFLQQQDQFSQQPNTFIQQQQPQRGFSSGECPERNGRFPVPSQCDAYIECTDGVAKQELCPEGLLFNPEARFNYPCGYPIDVKCEGRSALQPAQPTDECPHQYGYFKIGDRKNCGKFKNCVEGKAHVFDCPEGLAYNPDTYRCDWPDQVADCDAEAFLGFVCPTTNQNSFLNPAARFYRSPHDCHHYYVCGENNQPRLQNCGEGNAFNELTGACDAAVNVTGCEPQTFNKVGVEPVRFDARSENQLRSLRPQQNSFIRHQSFQPNNERQRFTY